MQEMSKINPHNSTNPVETITKNVELERGGYSYVESDDGREGV